MAKQVEWLALIEENESLYGEEQPDPAYTFSGRTFYQEEDTGAYRDD